MKKIVALVAALVLTVPIAGCGPRDRRGGPGPTSEQTPSAPAADPAAAEDSLDELDDLLGGLDDALADADGFEASADAD